MKLIKTALAATLFSATLSSAALAAECQLRNIQFVGIVADGRLVVNAEMFNVGSNAHVGFLANSTLCRVNATHNGITADTCRAWHSTATTAFLSYKKIYITADSCLAGNGVTLTNVGYFGINH